MFHLKLELALTLVLSAADCKAQLITTFAGTDWNFPALQLPAINAPLNEIRGIGFARGDVYFSDCRNNRVMRVSPDGTLTVIAGNGISGFSGDGGPAVQASLYCPSGVTIDGAANLYIADFGNVRVRKVTPDGIITTIAGNGKFTWPGDGGLATDAGFNGPEGLAVDSAGNLYISDNGYVRKVAFDGTITTFADVGLHGGFTAPFTGLAIDAAGNLYVTGAGTGGISKITPSGVITVVVDRSLVSGAVAVAVDTAGNLYLAEGGAKQDILKVTPSGTITTIAGSGKSGFGGDNGPALAASLNGPFGVAVDPTGQLFIADDGNDRVRKVTTDGIISTIAGNGLFRFSGDGAPAVSAVLGYEAPTTVTTDSSDNVYIVDSGRIRKITPDGIIRTVAGNGTVGFSGDGGKATDAQFGGGPGYNTIFGLSVDRSGNLFIADGGNGRIRKVTPDGTITTVAGNGSSTHSGDGGLAIGAGLVDPQDVVVDPLGNLIIAELGSLRKVTPAGIITTLNGSVSARKLALDFDGNIYTVEGSTIGKLTPAGIHTIVAGTANPNGFGGFSGDGGPATRAQLSPYAVAVDMARNLYIADTGNNRIRKVSPDGVITTIAGGSFEGYSGDGGLATSAALYVPEGVAVSAKGNVYIADTFNSRVRVVLANPPAVQVSTQSLNFSGQSTGAPAPKQSFNISSLPGLAFSLTVSTSTGGNWLSVTPQNGTAPRLVDVVADPSIPPGPGTYSGTITINTPNANPATSTVHVIFTVSAVQPPSLAPLDPRNFTFSFAKSTPAQSQSLTISNSGGGTLNFSATANLVTPSGASPLTLSQTTGKATPGSPAILTLTAEPTGLGPGTFTGTVSVSAGNTTLSVPVTITVSALDQAIQLSQRGLSFTAVEQGGVIPAQTFAVRNIGAGVVAWTAKTVPPAPINGIVSTVPWLSVSPASGTTDAAQNPPSVTVSVDASKLIEGVYYGLVEVDAPTAANSPQLLTVAVQVMKAGFNAGAVLAPGSLLFTAVSGQSSPGSQNVAVYNVAAKAKSFRSAVSTDPGLKIVTLPTDATLDPQNPTSMVVQPFTDGLAPGVYNGVVTLQFDDGRVLRFMIKVIVTATGGASSGLSSRSHSRDASRADVLCTPKTMQPILVAPNDSFQGLTGTGIKIGVFVKDNCGVPLEAGSVTVTFSNGDSRANLTSLRGGLWEGNWYTRNPSPSVNLTLTATNPAGISGTATTNGSVAMQQPPVFDNTGIVSAFGGPSFAPLAPGGVIFVNGSALAETSQAASGVPLLPTLVDTQVTIGLQPMPLYAVSDQQVKAVVPYSLTQSLNAPLQIVVQRGTTLSQPVDVTVATAEPVIYSGDKAVTSAPADGGMSYIVTQDNPAHIGDTITIYCVGLGAVDPPVADGGLPSGISSPAPVQMLIGEQAAMVTFQGLTPQLPGIYKVSGVVPASASTGSSVPVTINVGGQTSPPILIPIQ